MSELEACSRYFESAPQGGRIQRLIFFSGRSVEKNICEKVGQLAQKMQIPAQIGDVLGAVEIPQSNRIGIDRRGSQVDWTTAFGLSLTGDGKIFAV